MRKSRYSPLQIVQARWQAEGGTAVLDICWRLGVPETAVHRSKTQYVGLDVSELRNSDSCATRAGGCSGPSRGPDARHERPGGRTQIVPTCVPHVALVRRTGGRPSRTADPASGLQRPPAHTAVWGISRPCDSALAATTNLARNAATRRTDPDLP